MTAEELLGMVILAAAREQVIARRLLGQDAPDGYHYVWGYVVWSAKPPEWLPGLWEAVICG
jgi:hypothetical protein